MINASTTVENNKRKIQHGMKEITVSFIMYAHAVMNKIPCRHVYGCVVASGMPDIQRSLVCD